MTFHSILYDRPGDGNERETQEAPDFFRNLNLDQIVDAITTGRQEYNLKPFFHTRLTNTAAIAYRQEIMRDLEKEFLCQSIGSFSTQMRTVRAHLRREEELHYKYEKERWFLDAVQTYCKAVEGLLLGLNEGAPNSRGLRAFREHLKLYAGSERFQALHREANRLNSELSAIRYCLLINDNSITVRNYDSEIDYSTVVEDTFSKFRQGAVKDYRVGFAASPEMNHVEAQILESVAKLNPEAFLTLDAYCANNRDFVDGNISAFEREIQFYLAYLEFTGPFKQAGLEFCHPEVSDSSKEISNRNGYDLALAGKLIRENAAVVCNDFFLDGEERIFVVTGPNQGGKTTFARAFGQLHYLASLGCPVPGTEARLYLFDHLFTHFEREEDVTTLRGKLQDDLFRIHRVLDVATSRSIIIMNEIFSSTTVEDAAYLGRKVIERISQLDALCVCVTFLDELASLNEKTVSAVAMIDPDNPTLRTHKIERKPADGLSYALAIARKYGLVYERLKKRLST